MKPVLGCIMLISFIAKAGDLAGDAANWVPVNLGSVPEFSVVNSALQVRNSSNSLGLLRHDITSGESFTYTARVRVTTNQYRSAGIYFSLTGNLGGYFFTVHPGQVYSLYRLPVNGGPSTILAFLPSSHLHPTDNILTICKQAGKIDLYCNGKFLQTIQDTQFGSGSIGLVVDSSMTALFDNVSLKTGIHAPVQPPCFTDDFTSDALTGWYMSGYDGQVAVSGGSAVFSVPENISPQIVFTSGNHTGSSLRAVVTRRSEATSGLYGLCLIDVTQTATMGYTYRAMAFLINGARNYAVVPADAQSYIVQLPRSFIKGTTDTLEVKFEQQKYRFYVNGQLLDSLSDSRTLEGAGLYISDGLSISCDQFTVAPGSEPICRNNPVYAGNRRHFTPVTSSPVLVFDPLGRRIPGRAGSTAFVSNGIILMRIADGHAAATISRSRTSR